MFAYEWLNHWGDVNPQRRPAAEALLGFAAESDENEAKLLKHLDLVTDQLESGAPASWLIAFLRR